MVGSLISSLINILQKTAKVNQSQCFKNNLTFDDRLNLGFKLKVSLVQMELKMRAADKLMAAD
jgi:hypothetical protein